MNINFLPRGVRGRRRTVAFLGLIVIGLPVGAASASTTHPNGDPPEATIVLVHGAFADASSWNGVIAELTSDGYEVIAPANPLRGVDADSRYLAEFLDTVAGPIVLVGHSYGGFVITNAATGNPNVAALAYVAAFAPATGETVGGISASVPGSLLAPDVLVVRPFTRPDGTESAEGYIAPARYHEVFAADVEPDLAIVLAATQRPADLAILAEPSGEPAWKTIPSFTIIATEDRVIPPDVQRTMAERAGATTIEVDASHSVAVAQPATVAEFIVDSMRSAS